MKIAFQKKHWPPLIIILICLPVYAWQMFNTGNQVVKKNTQTFSSTKSSDEQATQAPVTSHGTVEGTVTAVQPVLPNTIVAALETFPNPFANLPIASPQTASIVSPSGSLPPVPSVPSIPPASGALPAWPGQAMANTPPPTVHILTVTGILYKNGSSNLAVLSDGQQETIVAEYSDSPWGYVSSIDQNSIVLNGKRMWLDHEAGPSLQNQTRRTL